MKILILHSRYLSGDASGENRVVEDEAKLLADAGHEVRVWQPSLEGASGLGLVKAGAGALWSRQARARIRDVIRRWGSQVVHFHNLFPSLSPAAIPASVSEGAAVVVTLHNYRYMCLPSTFLRDDRVCEDCLGHVPWRGVVHRCYRDSFLGSATLAASLSVHRVIGSLDRATLFAPVSVFVRDKYVEAGFSRDRMVVKSNFSWGQSLRNGPGEYFLYAGRLSAEKGLKTLIGAWKDEFGRLVIVGDGPERDQLVRLAGASVEFRGLVPASEIPSFLNRARALVLPSLCDEAQPRIVLEAYAAGVPVLASRMGGLPEMVIDGETGYLLPAGSVSHWIHALERLISDDESERLGHAAQTVWEERYSPERGLQNLEAIYERALTLL